MNKDNLLEIFFNNWISIEKVNNRTIEYSIYIPTTPIFSSYDAWKLASNDDYYREVEQVIDVDIDSLYDYISEQIEEEFDFKEIFNDSISENEIIKEFQNEFFTIFERLYLKWTKKQIENLSN